MERAWDSDGSIDGAVRRARAAQPEWERRPPRERLRPVRALRHLLALRCDALTAALKQDLGKPPEEALGGDLLPLADACRFLERAAAGLLQPRRVPRSLRPCWLWGQHDTVYRRARGVVAVIGTWNYPFLLNGVQLVQALTAGNAVVWKPSEVAPASAAALQELFSRAGFPAGVAVVLEPTRAAGQALIEADIDHVVFTGAAATGRHVARRLGERLVSSTLELSGCDAQFVLDDADVTLAARAAWFGATLNGGQTCLAVRRAFVQRPVYAAFCEALQALATGARPLPAALPAQAEQAERLVRAALAEGGKLLTEGANPVPGACRPAVVADARPEMALCREATFAPVLAVLPFDAEADALGMQAACPYALGASIFTAAPARARALAARLRSGVVTINDVIVPTAHPATPFGGRGDSGWGVTQGAEGLLAMTVPQVVSQRRGRFRPHYDLATAGGDGATRAAQGELLRGLLEANHAPTWWQRMRGWRRALAALLIRSPPPDTPADPG